MSGLPPKPARGAVAGVKADLAKAKKMEQEGKYNPVGTGNAFTHNFLNQKPWHPLNFRNQITKWEAEQKAIADQKAKEQGQAEFEAEQESMRTMSYLSEAEQQRYRDRQSIQWLYTKPPGLEAALAKEASAVKAPEAAPAAPAAGSSGAGGKGNKQPLTPAQQQQHEQQQQAHQARTRELDRVREDPFAVMLTARVNLQNSDRFVIKHSGGNTSPSHGGYDKSAENQRLLGYEAPTNQQGTNQAQEVGPGVVADAEDLALLESMTDDERSAVLRRLRKMQRQAEKEQQLQQAQAVLWDAGYDLSALQQSEKHSKKSKKKKKKKKHKEDGPGSERQKRRRSSSSSGSDDG